MPLDFPASPSINDVYSFDGKIWVYTGAAWKAVYAGSPEAATAAENYLKVMSALTAQFYI